MSELINDSTKFFLEDLLASEMKRTEILMNKSGYSGILILELSKVLIYDFWYGYIKPKYGENVKFSFMNTENLIVHVKTEDICKDIAGDVKTRFHTLNCKVER